MLIDDSLFKIKHNDTLPARGSILISEPFSQEPYFQRSVVLLVDHSHKSSMGFVLNKKSNLFVNSFFKELELCHEMPIYIGGPVSPNRLFFIHSLGEEVVPDSIKVNDHLYFDGDFESLKKYVLAGNSIQNKVKFFLGYSGWSEGQLNSEIEHDAWIVSKTTNHNVMFGDGELLWKRMLESLGTNYAFWLQIPKDPYLN